MFLDFIALMFSERFAGVILSGTVGLTSLAGVRFEVSMSILYTVTRSEPAPGLAKQGLTPKMCTRYTSG